MGSKQDPTWWDFPHTLAETGGARRYITLFEAPFQASVLTDHESNTLRAGSLMAIPPPPLGSQPLARSFTIDLPDMNLLQWASQVQEVASHMRWPPETAVSCPQADMVVSWTGWRDSPECDTADAVLGSARGVSALQSLTRLLA